MINKNELLKFITHCKEQYGIQVEDNVIEDFVQFVNREKARKELPSQHSTIDCGFNTSVCAHINFDTVQCDSCAAS